MRPPEGIPCAVVNDLAKRGQRRIEQAPVEMPADRGGTKSGTLDGDPIRLAYSGNRHAEALYMLFRQQN